MILLAGVMVGTLLAKTESDSTWIRGVYAGKSPRVITLSAPVAWERANALAGKESRAFVVVGTGGSMRPLYPPGTLLVLRTVAYDELQPGQTAVYRNKSCRAVAHVLVAKTTDGWRATGLANPTHDMEPVLEDNLIGVVIAAYQPQSEPVSGLLAAR